MLCPVRSTFLRLMLRLMVVAALLAAVLGWSSAAHAHFSYSDPRVIHMAPYPGSGSVILIRMPAPLALLPADWRGAADTRTPAFARVSDGETLLDPTAVLQGAAELREQLAQSLVLVAGGQRVDFHVDQFRFWSDDSRPGFGTLTSALKVFDAPPEPILAAALPYFGQTLDVMILVPHADLADDLRLYSDLGRHFQVIEKLGTIVKLHREQATETRAVMGVLDVSFPRLATTTDFLLGAALTGAEHIYRGLDHLAIILLIAIGARNWRQACSRASAFTLGHVITLTAGLYGIAPAAGWFVPAVELAIALSIMAAGLAICCGRDHMLGWGALLVIGLVHGYGFAASASEALFAGQIDPLNLAAFALGLEGCQLAIYALILPIILLIDHARQPALSHWRHGVALVIALIAVSAVFMRFSDVSNAFGFA